jgi:transposase
MSTSLLYRAFGVRGYQYHATKYAGNTMTFSITQPRHSYRCPECGSDDVIGRGQTVRIFRSLPIGDSPTFISLPVPRVECRRCNVVRQVKVSFAEPRRTYTRAFARYALALSQMMTIKDAALRLGVSWDVVKEIQKKYLTKKYAKPKLRHLRQIAIDEISVGKGHKYITIVMDLGSGAVVHVGKGKGGDALLPFWKRLRRSRAKIEAVATDMSLAYISAVTTHLPEAALIFDRFHVIKLYNEKLTGLRRAMYRELEDTMEKNVLKGTRWLLLKRPENLDASRKEPERLEEALKLNKPLAMAYYLKEELSELWEQDDRESAEALLMEWITFAESSGIRMLKDFAKTLRCHAFGILGWYDYPISTGPLEGTNNKIKTMKRQAYGFRDAEFLKLKILGLHETKYALVG